MTEYAANLSRRGLIQTTIPNASQIIEACKPTLQCRCQPELREQRLRCSDVASLRCRLWPLISQRCQLGIKPCLDVREGQPSRDVIEQRPDDRRLGMAEAFRCGRNGTPQDTLATLTARTILQLTQP